MAAQIWTKKSMFLLPHIGAGAPERNPGQQSPGGKEQLDQQGLHLSANLQRRGASEYYYTQRRNSHTVVEPTWRLPLWMERQEVVLASQRETRE